MRTRSQVHEELVHERGQPGPEDVQAQDQGGGRRQGGGGLPEGGLWWRGVWCRVLSDSAIKSFARNSEFLSKILQINLERGIMLCKGEFLTPSQGFLYFCLRRKVSFWIL